MIRVFPTNYMINYTRRFKIRNRSQSASQSRQLPRPAELPQTAVA